MADTAHIINLRGIPSPKLRRRKRPQRRTDETLRPLTAGISFGRRSRRLRFDSGYREMFLGTPRELPHLPAMNRRVPWTAEQDQRLLQMEAQNQPRELIAAALMRTRWAVQQRLAVLRKAKASRERYQYGLERGFAVVQQVGPRAKST